MVNGLLNRHAKLLTLSLLAASTALVTACTPSGQLQSLIQGKTIANKTTSANKTANGAKGSGGTNPLTTVGVTQNGPGARITSFTGVPVGGSSFDPQGLFEFYDDDIHVTESGDTVYVSWESYTNGDEVYTSIEQGGQWIVRDKPVYSLAPFSKDGNWSRYLSGNELAVVNHFTNTSFMVKWNQSGQLTTQQTLYKGWVGGDFSMSVDGGLAVMLHLPYGAPTGGARYNLYLPSQPAAPKVVTIGTSQFTGALYALDTAQNRVYEVQTNTAGQHVLDVYKTGQPGVLPSTPGGSTSGSLTTNASGTGSSSGNVGSTSSGGSSVLINTLPVMDNRGQLLQTKLPGMPQLLAVSPQGTVYTLTRDSTSPGTVSVVAYDQNLKQVSSWQHVKTANPYAQNVEMSVTTGVVHLFAVVNYQGQAALQEIDLK